MPIPTAETIVSETIITGSLMGSTLIQIDIPHLIALYEDNRLMLDELISARYPLS